MRVGHWQQLVELVLVGAQTETKISTNRALSIQFNRRASRLGSSCMRSSGPGGTVIYAPVRTFKLLSSASARSDRLPVPVGMPVLETRNVAEGPTESRALCQDKSSTGLCPVVLVASRKAPKQTGAHPSREARA